MLPAFTGHGENAEQTGGDVLAADGKFIVPIAGTFALDGWRTAMEISLSGQARGKLLLLP